MKNFWVLAGFEYKKLLTKKMVWVTVSVLTIVAVCAMLSALIGTIYIDEKEPVTQADALQADKLQSEKLEGSKVDDNMLRNLKIMEQSPNQKAPNDLLMFLMRLRGDNAEAFLDNSLSNLTEEELYETRDSALEKNWSEKYLSEDEKEALRTMNQRIKKPFIYHYAGCYKAMAAMGGGFAMMQCILIAVCIPLIFSDEHQGRMKQLTICSRLGKGQLFAVKTFVGITFSTAGTLVLYISMFITAVLIYGGGGFKTQLQMPFPLLSWNLTIGQAVCILLALFLLAAVLESSIVMLLADKYRSSTVPMAILAGFTILSLALNIPPQYKILSQVWGYTSAKLFTVPVAFGDKMISVFGKYWGTWQSAPVFYLLLTAAVIFAAYKGYARVLAES